MSNHQFWLESSIKELSELIKDGTHGTHKDVARGVPLLSAKDIFNGKLSVPSDSRKISEQEYSQIHSNYQLEINDLLITLVGTIGRIVKIKSIEPKFTFQRSVGVIRFKKILDSKFAYYFLCSEYFQTELNKSINSSAQGGVYLGTLGKLKIFYPPLPQQQKIARILSTVDAVIEKTEAAIAKYKAIKAGMMHDLFTRGIDDNGQLRPTYEDSPECYKHTALGWIPKAWEISELITVAKDNQYSFTGGPFGSDLKSSDYTKRGVRIIQLQNIGDGCFLNAYKIYTSEEKADNLSSCNIFPNNIIIAKMADPVARACIMPMFDSRYLMASDGIRLEVNEKRFNVSFIKESINSPYFRSRAINLSTGTTRARIGLSALKSILIKHPLLSEQNSISQKIETIDKKIELEQITLKKYQKIKQGLMQDLLTGKVKVSIDTTH